MEIILDFHLTDEETETPLGEAQGLTASLTRTVRIQPVRSLREGARQKDGDRQKDGERDRGRGGWVWAERERDGDLQTRKQTIT